MKLEMLLSSLLLTILSTKFKPGEALNGMREYKKNWQESTHELLKRNLLAHTLNDKSSDVCVNVSHQCRGVFRTQLNI